MNKLTSAGFFKVFCIAALIFICACGRIELYQNLTEDDANEILVLLSENGIKANKKRVVEQNEVSYSLELKETDLAKARSLLLQHNLPRKKEIGLDLYSKPGLIPTPDEQKARFLLATKGEIINSLEKIPQIMDANVILNVPTRDQFADADKQKDLRPTASVNIRVKPDASGLEAITVPQIQQFVANAVEGLNPRDVTVIISYVTTEQPALRPGDVRTLPTPGEIQPPPSATAIAPSTTHEMMGLKLDIESKGRLKVYLLVFFLLLVILSSALIIVIIQGSRMRRTLAALQGPAGDHPAIEGQVLEEGPPRLGGGGDQPTDEL